MFIYSYNYVCLHIYIHMQKGEVWDLLVKQLGPPPLSDESRESVSHMSWWIAALLSEVVPHRLSQVFVHVKSYSVE